MADLQILTILQQMGAVAATPKATMQSLPETTRHRSARQKVWDLGLPGLCLVVVALGACDADAPAGVAKRRWQIEVDDYAGGAFFAATVDHDGAVALVGGDVESGGIWRSDGATLTRQAIPDGPLLNWIDLGPDQTLLAVGNGRRALWRTPNGEWQQEALPAGDVLWGCHNGGDGAAWAVGANVLEPGRNAAVLLRRTNAGWQLEPVPPLAPDQQNAQLFKVAAARPDDALVVGDDGVILHWDGVQWLREDAGTRTNLVTTRALPDGRFVVVGGLASGEVWLRSVSGGWTKLASTMVGLSGVDASGEQLIVAGMYGWIEHVDLKTGVAAPVDEPLTAQPLHFVLALPNGDALAGGGSYLQPGLVPMRGTLLRWKR